MSSSEAEASWQELIDKVYYSDRYSTDLFEYRHVILPKSMLRLLPSELFDKASNKTVLRILSEEEWRGIGIMQSLGWEHYEVHKPEPWVLLFRREVDFAAKHPHLQQQ
ncbi:regulatory subunit of cyclin-dependent kinase [Mrakia frigida]|uniref:cyclin-dependent kinases regulatory subunit n=1 Tax=Mrakia frigida TaxID=29902 RepID=UPI003FCBF1A6